MTFLSTKYEGGLSALLKGVCNVPVSYDKHVTDITTDSREAIDGSCFFALEGSSRSGADFADDAINRGASTVIYQKQPIVLPPSKVSYLVVPKIKEALGDVARRFFGDPSKSLKVYAVTGTNGKTTVSYLMSKALGFLEGTCGYLGTLGKGLSSSRRLAATINTTPDVITLNRALNNFLTAGAKSCAIEASSIGLSQGRIDALNIDTALYTNLGLDHLDFHGSYTDYKNAKLSLFQNEAVRNVVLSLDDEFGRFIFNQIDGVKKVLTISNRLVWDDDFVPDIFSSELSCKITGSSFNLNYREITHDFETRLIGDFNVANVLLVVGALLLSGFEMGEIRKALRNIKQIPGRMQLSGQSSDGVLVFVDYAHTPEGLEGALSSLRPLSKRKISVVFGCGGDRDRSKRAVMGLAAYKGADYIFLTSDNSRGEKTEDIVKDICKGIPNTNNTHIIFDRAAAIRAAIEHGEKDDIVLIAGKGHESYQEVDGKRFKHDDRRVVKKLLSEREFD
ncbi:MAG: UDP-N-acetylmuramoyl-L-alanyl-D-glutamate--2,6-diaminopimelate ligase [Pseudomonadota bacterium]|nr:UDP-N-acetylmuramoyl-L-alanyl-D-glutamate--2,6-diaminopimelate ligase [Pseudomonadota bacterium]